MKTLQKWRKKSYCGCCWRSWGRQKMKRMRRRCSTAGEGKQHVVNQHSLDHPCAALVLVIQGSHFDVHPALCAVMFGCVWGKICQEEYTKVCVCVYERYRERITCYIRRNQDRGRIWNATKYVDFSWNVQLLYVICLHKIQVTLNVSYGLGHNTDLWWKRDIRPFLIRLFYVLMLVRSSFN